MSYETLPIVGAYYRKPAPTLLDCLAVNTPLSLLAEPTNEYDPNAIAVFLASADIPEEALGVLEERLAADGYNIEQILGQTFWHLGYVPKEIAAQMKAAGVVNDEETLAVTFAVDAKGKPRVRFPSPIL